MKIIFIFSFIISSSLSQEIFVQTEEKNLYRSAVEYSFDEILDNGAYTFALENLSGIIKITGHAGSGSHLVIDNRVRAVSNKNAIAILKNSQINVYHDDGNKNVSIKKLSERYDHKIITTIDLHIPINTNIKGFVKNGDVQINKLRGSVDLKTESVDTELNNLSGNIVFNTKGGNINIKKTNGTIRLNVISGDIDIMQCEGNIFTSIENGIVKLEKIKGEIKSATTLGDIEISYFDGRQCSFDINVGNLIAKNCNSDFNVNIDINPSLFPIEDKLNSIVNYETVINLITKLAKNKHYELLDNVSILGILYLSSGFTHPLKLGFLFSAKALLDSIKSSLSP